MADAALACVLKLIAGFGSGVVESYPEDAADRKVSRSFRHTATLATLTRQGFEPTRRIGKNRWVVRALVA